MQTAFWFITLVPGIGENEAPLALLGLADKVLGGKLRWIEMRSRRTNKEGVRTKPVGRLRQSGELQRIGFKYRRKKLGLLGRQQRCGAGSGELAGSRRLQSASAAEVPANLNELP